jgi:hypothetical protein
MTMSDVDQGPSDDELFNEAVSDETPDAPVVSEQAEQRARDEAGRFAKKEEPEAAEVVAEVQAEKPIVDDNASQVPSWRVREINEEKRAALAELETLRAERAQWQQRQQQPKPEPVERPAKPDPLLDPDGYAKSVRDEIREDILSERREESLQQAAEAHPDEFKEAYTAAQKAVDPALKARMQSSRDPGEDAPPDGIVKTRSRPKSATTRTLGSRRSSRNVSMIPLSSRRRSSVPRAQVNRLMVGPV